MINLIFLFYIVICVRTLKLGDFSNHNIKKYPLNHNNFQDSFEYHNSRMPQKLLNRNNNFLKDEL